jgi:acetoacetate decarboxylase
MRMIEEEVRKTAFAMPIANPSYPVGLYRFTDREYMPPPGPMRSPASLSS